MAVSVSHASLPYPIKNARFSLLIPYLDSTGTPTDPTTPAAAFSSDNAAFATCAETPTVVGSGKGFGLHTVSGAETNCSALALSYSAASGPKTTLATLYPKNLAVMSSGTLSAGSAGGGTLGTILAYDITGCFIRTTGGTGGGGTGGANNQARRIATYNTTTGVFTVTPNWETNPDNTTTYDILLPDGLALGSLPMAQPERLGIFDAGVASASSGTTLTLAAATPFTADNSCQAMFLAVKGSVQGYWQCRQINSYVASTKVATVDAWPVQPTGTLQYMVLASAPFSTANVLTVNAGYINNDATAAANLAKALNGTGGVNITATFVGSLTGAVGSVTNPVTAGTVLDKLGYDVASFLTKQLTLTGITPDGKGVYTVIL